MFLILGWLSPCFLHPKILEEGCPFSNASFQMAFSFLGDSWEHHFNLCFYSVCLSLLCLSNLLEPEYFKVPIYTWALPAMKENTDRDHACFEHIQTFFFICCNNYFYCTYIASAILCNLGMMHSVCVIWACAGNNANIAIFKSHFSIPQLKYVPSIVAREPCMRNLRLLIISCPQLGGQEPTGCGARVLSSKAHPTVIYFLQQASAS